MEQPIRTVICRDGIRARVQTVPYLGEGGGHCLFGFRMHPADAQLMVDIWNLNGRWAYDQQDHPFDICRQVIGSPSPAHLHAST